jgi:hypothetical protein
MSKHYENKNIVIGVIGSGATIGKEIIETVADKNRGIILVSVADEIGMKKLTDTESFPIRNYILPELICHQPPLTRKERRKQARIKSKLRIAQNLQTKEK